MNLRWMKRCFKRDCFCIRASVMNFVFVKEIVSQSCFLTPTPSRQIHALKTRIQTYAVLFLMVSFAFEGHKMLISVCFLPVKKKRKKKKTSLQLQSNSKLNKQTFCVYFVTGAGLSHKTNIKILIQAVFNKINYGHVARPHVSVFSPQPCNTEVQGQAEPENIAANPVCIFNAKLNNTIISARN